MKRFCSFFSVLSSGLSLLEILIAIAVIAMLGALTLPAVRAARARAAIVSTQSLIAQIEAALAMYQADIGDYPSGEGEGCSHLIACLTGPSNLPEWRGPYMRIKESDLNKNRSMQDLWNTPFFYLYPQTLKETVPFILISAGPDRRFHTKDDINNW